MPLKLFKAGAAADAEQTAADLVSLQLLPPGLMKVKFRDVCRKYGRSFVAHVYADMVLRTGGGGAADEHDGRHLRRRADLLYQISARPRGKGGACRRKTFAAKIKAPPN